MPERSEGQEEAEDLEQPEECLLWGVELTWIDRHYWRDTETGESFATGMEAEEVVVVVEERAQGMTEE